MTEQGDLPIASVGKRFSVLERAESVVETVFGNQEFKDTVTNGYGELIDRFNSMEPSDSVLELMPKVAELKTTLGVNKLPTLMELKPRQVLKGVKEAVEKSEMGQYIKRDELPKTPENVKQAIGTPSMDTNNMALAIGTAGHVIERTMFNHFRDQGMDHQWTKDEILFALEDLSLLMHAEMLVENKPDSILFRWIATSNSETPEGGLGWRKNTQVDDFIGRYQDFQASKQ
jgi:hypothetical protein